MGVSWEYFTAAAEKYGLKCEHTESIDAVLQALKEGKEVISTQGPGLFTMHGHVICLYKADANNNIIVKDPNWNNAGPPPAGKGYDDRTFTPEEITQSGHNFWIFSK